ncbi:MAG TPA: hypothetical protein VGS20_13640 [Candidatus Acidoferrales bacterium]|nr:hypothetical protein [Candidatus Acidoferrales bacterium]
MRLFALLPAILLLAAQAPPTLAQDSPKAPSSLNILAAKSIYFDDQTGVPAVGNKALAQLKRWGRFRIVSDRKQADLVFLLSADPYKGGYIILSGGQTGTIDGQGKIQEDTVPNFNVAAPVRYAYLTIIDPKTGVSLWSRSRRWGGLLTGFNSAGERLVKELEKETKN